MDLKKIEETAATCTGCALHLNRNKPVFAKGNPLAKIVICGMVPGEEENKVGIPFVGRAGKCLDNLIEDSSFKQEEVYITNLSKCMLHPGIRLQQDWIDSCYPYFLTQMMVIQPKVIISLGADASNGLIGNLLDTPISTLRKSTEYFWFNVPLENKEMLGIPIIPTYHPSFAVRQGGKGSNAYKEILKDFDKTYGRL